jgi:threonine aldolase
MHQNKISLASDNWSPAHPTILQAVINANGGFAPAYGADEWTIKAEQLIQSSFQKMCKVFFVPTGTGANIYGLKVACGRHESIICSNIAHINYQESGAPESMIGCKLLLVPHIDGKIAPNEICKKLRSERAFGKHCTKPRILSIAQPTEVGTVYSLEELRALSQLCSGENLLFHVDGSRIYNAAVHLNLDLHQMFDSLQVDLLSLGGTKNGLLGAEALIIFNNALLEGSDHLQKQTLQLLSKMRYLSAQFIPFFQDDLWAYSCKPG